MRNSGIATPAYRPVAKATIWRVGLKVEIAVFGLVVAVFAGLLWPLYDAPSIGSDSGNILSIARLAFHNDWSTMLEKQAPPLTILVYGLAARLSVPLNSIPVLTGFLLPLFLAFVVYRETRSYLLAAVPILIIAASRTFWLQNTSLSPYAAFVLLGYAGLYLSGRYLLGMASLRVGILGAFLIATSLYTFGQALPYLLTPSLFLILSPTKLTFWRLTRLYVALTLLALPWLISHLAVGGLQEFYHYPRSWLAATYGEYIKEFWGRRYYDSFPLYLARTFQIFILYVLPPWGWALVAGGLYAIWLSYGGRVVLFIAAMALIFMLPVVVTMSPIFPRYWYSLLPLFALVITAGIQRALLDASKAVVIGGAVSLLVVSLVSTVIARDQAYDNNIAREISAQRDLERFAALVEVDHRSIISRDARIQSLTPGNQVYNNLLMRQPDFITYLTWPDDEAVARVFSRYQIGWVLLYNDNQRWEIGYNAWLPEAAGQLPSHFWKIHFSGLVEAAYEGEIYTLYKLRDY